MTIGALLFLLRERRRAIYAYLEIAVAATVALEAYVRFTPTKTYSGLTVSLAAAIYVAVRGYDNLAIAIRAKRKQE